MNPFQQFSAWYEEEQQKSQVRIPSACCLSTIGLDGFPNARFVSLKEVKDETFIVTGPLNSRKSIEIHQMPQVALTFWWPATERQVRIQGNAIEISPEEADKYFSQREKDARLVAYVSDQGKEIESLDILNRKYEEADNLFKGNGPERPENWGGYMIEPIRIELMAFKESRFHERVLFLRTGEEWKKVLLQP